MARGTLDKRAKRSSKTGKKAQGTAEAEATAEEACQPVSEDTDGAGGEAKKGGKHDKDEEKDGKKKFRKLLREAVKNAIRENSVEVAKSLIHKVVDGDKRSTEMMFSLIKKKKKQDVGEKRHGGLTAADLLGSEDEWESESYAAQESKAASGAGGRAPEGEAAVNCAQETGAEGK
jgi:hypothetical protein